MRIRKVVGIAVFIVVHLLAGLGVVFLIRWAF